MRSHSPTGRRGNLGQASDAVVTGLLQGLADPESDVRFSAAFALGKLGKRNEDRVIPAVSTWLEQNVESAGSGNAVGTLWQIVMGEE